MLEVHVHFGALLDQPLHVDDFASFEIAARDFEAIGLKSKHTGRT